MPTATEDLVIRTRSRGTYDITRDVQRIVTASGITSGLCTVFVAHTSASVIVTENADPQVRKDLEAFAARFAPDGDTMFEHDAEGPDDMPAHVRAVFTSSSVNIPVRHGRCALGTWQGIYLWEHRTHGHERNVLVTVVG